MAVLKCKMCGDNIEVSSEKTYGTCESCGSTMTLPKIDDDQRANLFNRANRFRQIGEFDKAILAYESILNQDDGDAEAHWCVVLSRYGIEYVVDPKTGKRVPTCHRLQTMSILNDPDYLAALEHTSDLYTKELYKKEATRISQIQKEIMAISVSEAPYDVFICYKESDKNGNRTKDSTLAQDVYYQLTGEGYKVFFARITLEDKLGTAYEPYIFAALNSAKVMIVVGSKQEYFNAIWVKNEWSRYLDLMSKDKSRLLIPCYRDMDAYDIPDALSMYQSQDMGKIGFIQDLIRGVKKVLVKEEASVVKEIETVKADVATLTPGVESLLSRVELFLEDGEWGSVTEYCNKILDLDAKCAMAYVYLLCAKLKCRSMEKLPTQDTRFLQDKDCQKAIRFGGSTLKNQLEGYDKTIANRLEENRKARLYKTAMAKKKAGAYKEAVDNFSNALGYKDAESQIEDCKQIKQMLEEKHKLHLAAMIEKKQQYQKTLSALCVCHTHIKTLNLIIENIKKQQSSLEAQIHAKQCEYDSIKIAFLNKQKKRKEQLQQEINQLHEELAKCTQELQTAQNSEALIEAQRQARHYLGGLREKHETISAGGTEDADVSRIVGIRADGAVVSVGGNSDTRRSVGGWTGIVAISAGCCHAVGLKSDGTVVTDYAQCNVGGWTNIVAVSTGDAHIVGLKSDGTVVAVGDNSDGRCNVGGWTGIVAISAGCCHTVGLKSDGTVVAAGANVNVDFGQCGVSDWSDIMAISAGYFHTVGLKPDGTVVAVGGNITGECDVGGWTNIVAISAGLDHTIGLKADGTVVATGSNKHGQCDVSNWTDIVAVSVGGDITVGLKSNGTVVAVGYAVSSNGSGQCDVSDWIDIKLPTT